MKLQWSESELGGSSTEPKITPPKAMAVPHERRLELAVRALREEVKALRARVEALEAERDV